MAPPPPPSATRAIVVLITTRVGTAAVVNYSHYSQTRDKMEMKKGVERDKQRLRLRKAEREKNK